ncbi:MAG: hypothetical protein GY810_13355 [Aureispira sp.]|nr:hypothetical protein [Aureispira sp.]
MKKKAKASVPALIPTKPFEAYEAPETRYFLTKEEFDEAVGQDFIKHANEVTGRGEKFLVGLAHGKSPSGAYAYIVSHFTAIMRSELVRFTFTNSPLKRQRGLDGVTDAGSFVKTLLRKGLITKDQILGRSLNRNNLDDYLTGFNEKLGAYLKKHNKEGMDYVFMASDPTGRVAAITRNSTAFKSKAIAVLVKDRAEDEITATPYFISKSKRIAFLATKADKRRPLAWLYYRWGKANESPSFLRHLDRVSERLTVFIDDQALTWPQVKIERETGYGKSTIRLDLPQTFVDTPNDKRPVILLIHGFLGLNSFDNLLTSIPSHKYIAAAMHYGSVPDGLPTAEYSKNITKNINAVIDFFGSKGHPVYIFDHSMGNMYFMMLDRDFDKLSAVNKYLKGRIGVNPFFGQEAKHAFIGFLDNVMIPALSFKKGFTEKSMLIGARRIVPLDTKKGVRRRGIRLTKWMIKKDSKFRNRVWNAMKKRIVHLMTNMDSLPHLNRIPLERALSRLPAKLFAIQVGSALEESKTFDKQKGLVNCPKHGIPVLYLKSERDAVAKFVPKFAEGHDLIKVIDVTNEQETDLFREHLYHMVDPERTTEIIDQFIEETEARRK